MLGLPDGVSACLFDMDGVVTQTATVHAAAWKEMFDEFLCRTRQEHRDRVRPLRPAPRVRRLRRRQATAGRNPVVPGVPRHRPARGHPGRPAGDADLVRAEQPQERPGPGQDRGRRGPGLPGQHRLHQGGPGRGIRTAIVSASANTVAGPALRGHRGPVRHQDRRGHRQGARPARQAGAGHVPGRRRGARRARRARGGLRGRPGRGGGGPRGPLRPGGRRGPGRPGGRAQGARRRHRGQGPVGAPRGQHNDQAGRVRDRALAAGREGTGPGPAGPERVDLRAVQRAHRAARQPGRGRPARAARHLPQLHVRGPAAALRGGRLRVPRQRADRHQRHQRQDHPAAGRRRAVRHQVRHPELPRARPGPAGRHADPDRGLVLPGRGQGQGDLGAHGVADPARDRGHQLHGRAGGPDAAAGAAVRAGRQRGAAEAGQRPPAGRHPGGPAGQRGTPDLRRDPVRGSCWSTGRGPAGCGWRPACRT